MAQGLQYHFPNYKHLTGLGASPALHVNIRKSSAASAKLILGALGIVALVAAGRYLGAGNGLKLALQWISSLGAIAPVVFIAAYVVACVLFVPGSIITQPIAVADSYNVIGNVRIQPNAAQGLLANDRDPDTGNNTGLTASGPSTTTQAGNITINGGTLTGQSFEFAPLSNPQPFE